MYMYIYIHVYIYVFIYTYIHRRDGQDRGTRRAMKRARRSRTPDSAPVKKGGRCFLCARYPCINPIPVSTSSQERIFIELMTSDRKLKASREVSKSRIYET